MKRIISIDFDNVLADTGHAFLQWYNTRFGEDVDFTEMTHAYVQKNKVFSQHNDEISYIDFLERAHEGDNLQSVGGSHEGIQRLLNAGYELHVVTGRQSSQSEMTQVWLDRHFPDIFVKIWYGNDTTDEAIDKGTLCKNLGSMLHIDDFAHYAQDIAKQNIPVILIQRPWNLGKHDEQKGIYSSGSREDITLEFIEGIFLSHGFSDD